MTQCNTANTIVLVQDGSWDTPGKKDKFADQVFSVVEQFAPGFKDSVIGYDMLTVGGAGASYLACSELLVRHLTPLLGV